jgi:hypothetical protein
MLYWKYIDIDPDQVLSIQEKYKKILPDFDNGNFHQTVDIDIDSFMGVPVQRFALIQCMPNAIGKIHTDFRRHDWDNRLALQIPLENCEQSVTNFWESNYDPPTEYTINNHPYRWFDPDRCKLITTYRLTQPILFRIDIPHSVDNKCPAVRKAISIRFKKDPWHLFNK